ncbi:MAG: hypothetical protein JNL61_15015 [Rhizobiaceae bacterium]|nr:hypothetical protein [Rhizobiaceae bacterium]
MADARNTRPVSGEIMTSTLPHARQAQAYPDVVDAVYETVEPARRPQDAPAQVTPDSRPPATGLGSLRGDAAEPRSIRGRRAGAAFWTGGLASAALAFWVSGGHALFDLGAMAPTASAGNGGLRIAGLSSSVEPAASRSVLLVDGEAVNDGTEARPLPPLSIAVTGLDGSVTRYRLGTSGRSLGEGERFAFSGRFEVPKEGVQTVSVTFVE